MTQHEIESSLLRIRPGAEWSLKDGVLTWLDASEPEPTEAEIAAGWAEIVNEEATKAAAKASAIAKLEALGLTADEAAALFGL